MLSLMYNCGGLAHILVKNMQKHVRKVPQPIIPITVLNCKLELLDNMQTR